MLYSGTSVLMSFLRPADDHANTLLSGAAAGVLYCGISESLDFCPIYSELFYFLMPNISFRFYSRRITKSGVAICHRRWWWPGHHHSVLFTHRQRTIPSDVFVVVVILCNVRFVFLSCFCFVLCHSFSGVPISVQFSDIMLKLIRNC